MKIWIDIGHVAQLNFYLNVIKILSNDHELLITVLNRGKLLRIANKELDNVENCTVQPMGNHYGNKLSIILDANLKKLFKLLGFYKRHKPDLALTNGYLAGVIGKIFDMPVLMFNDDIERRLMKKFMKSLSTELFYVTGSEIGERNDGIQVFNALKEWSYLSTSSFIPNRDVLKKYNLEEGSYIFAREVITGTINYDSQETDIIASISYSFPQGMKVLLSLEDKSRRGHYPSDWILLEEPVEDIHSLIYFSKLLISSGDSMAREGAILGIPSIYCGIRKMRANDVMISKGTLFHRNKNESITLMTQISNNEILQNKEEFRKRLNEEWIDVTHFIVNLVNKYK